MSKIHRHQMSMQHLPVQQNVFQTRAPFNKFAGNQTMRGGLNSRSGNIAEHKGLQDDLRMNSTQFVSGRNSNVVKSNDTQGKFKGKRKQRHSKNSSRQSEPISGSNRSGKN